MKNIFMKSIISSVIILLFGLQNLFADDVRLKISESSINNVLGAITESKYLSYGTSDNGGYVTYYSIKPQSISLDVNAGNTFSMTLVVDAIANFNATIFNFDLVLTGQSITVTGTINLQTQGTGYKVTFVPSVITYNTNNWLKNVINVAITGLINKLPEISTSSNQPLLPSIASGYFVSTTPALSTTSTDIILGLTLAAGPRFITVQNDVNQRTDVGTIDEISVANNSILSSGDSPRDFEWNSSTIHRVQTPLALLDHTNGKNKYKNWFKGTNTNPESDVALRRIQLTVGTTDAIYSAKFPPAKHVQLSNLLDGSLTGGTVTYNTTTGATYDDYDYQYANGSASTSVPGEVNGFHYGFVNWSDGNTNRTRNIIVNSDVNLTANYTKILYSSSANATANNNQRKIAQTMDNTYFLVYERNNKIFLSKSADGINWENEVEVSTGTPYDICKSPSIVANENGNEVAVVWQGINSIFYGDGWDASNIYFRLYNNATSTWSSKEELPLFTISSSGYDATPVISRRDNSLDGSVYNTCVVWREPSGLAVTTKKNGTWTSVSYIPNTNGNCLWPAITRRNSDVFSICWLNGDADRIDYTETLYSTYYQQYLFAGQVSPSGWMMNQRPSIAVNGDRTVIVSWQSFSNVSEGLSVHVREKPMSQNFSSTITTFSSSSASGAKPVIGSFLDLSSYYLLWEVDGSIYSTRGLGNTWTTPSIIASGSSGGTDISAVNRTRSALRQLWKKSNGSIALYNAGLQKSGGAENFASCRLNRHIIIYLDSIPALREKGYKGMIAFEVAGMSKQSGSANIKIESRGEQNRLRSDKLTVGTNSDIVKLAGAYYAKGLVIPKNATLNEINNLITVSLKDANTDQTVKEVWNVPLSKLASRTGSTDGEYRETSISLSGLRNKEVYLDVTMAGDIQPIFVNDYFIITKDEDRMKKIFEKSPVVVTQYALHQNYPNPFNPSTTINFDLVEPNNVTLKIYNSLGQEMKTLVDDYYPEGNHEVHFNASSLSSGAYFYRIVAGKFTATKSLMLVK